MPGVICPLPPGKMNHFGIEASSGVTWMGWEPGREYTKNIVLKNMKAKMQKLQYKTPKSRYFTTMYPQPIAIGAGNSFTLPVTFRPLEKMPYEDKMEFTSTDGSFVVPMKAVLPQFKIEVPFIVDVGLCAVDDSVQVPVEIRNCGELVTEFQLECLEPFNVVPSDGVLEPRASSIVYVTFRPKAALVLEVNLVITFGADFSNVKTVRLIGIGKYPHLTLGSIACPSRGWGELETPLNFGAAFVGQIVENWIEITNHSPVNAPFHVEHPLNGPSQVEQVFRCKQKSGVVPALKSIRLPFSYSATGVGEFSTDYFYVHADGTPTKSVVKCMASCKGPVVSLSRTMMSFHKADAGETVTRPIEIINDSAMESTFQFQIDCSESVFKFELLTGTLPPSSRKTILLHFTPVRPIMYYRRIACLVQHQGVLFLDLLGTCHTETDRPAVLQPYHIRRYHLHVERGLSKSSPEQLNSQLADRELFVDDAGALAIPPKDVDICAEGTSGLPVGVSSDLQPMDEYFNDGYHSDIVLSPPHVSTDVHQLDFGQVGDLNNTEQQIFSLTNHTQGKITVVWMGDASHIFSVTPISVDILPEKSMAFKVAFRPTGPNKFFGAELEGFAFYKSMRDYRLTEDITHFPPWCITLTATGNTFQPNNEHFLPRFSLGPKKMNFTVVKAHCADYKTFCLTNTGSTPILYEFEKDLTGTYAQKPTKGLLAPAANQIFVVKFLPTDEEKVYKEILKLKLNEVDKHTQDLLVYGKVETADVLLDKDGMVYFKPTCVGSISQRLYAVTNLSRSPVCFEWKVKDKDSKVLTVEPMHGIIQPNEKQYHSWYFKPKTLQKYLMKPTLSVWCQLQLEGSSLCFNGTTKQTNIRVIGEGSVGQLSCKEKTVDFGPLVVGTVANHHITLANDSGCNVRYKLVVIQEVTGPYANEHLYQEGLAIELSETEGTMASRTTTDVMITVRPVKRVTYHWGISYATLTYDSDNNLRSGEMQSLCKITATGVFPTMAVTDARCYGSTSGLSKKQLWNLFCIDNLNMFLDGDPSVEELTYNVPIRRSMTRTPPVYTRAILDLNFSAAPVASDACIVQLMFENNGSVPCDWAFLYPTDLQLELEYWAETGEYTIDELHEMKILENKLFSVEPKKGKLNPGNTCTVSFTYRHVMVGTDRLPVLLKLNRGREILLNFVGVTVELDRPYVHFPSTRFMFAPVPIGETRGPTQIYEMYNGGAVPVKYEIDTMPLRALTQDNYSHPIYECLNNKGEIQPGTTAAIEWKFSPLEAKTYSLDVDIVIDCGEAVVITFTGIGFDRRHMGSTMPITDQPDHSGVPSVQSVPVPGQLCFLNQERVSFGNVPLFTRTRKVVIMRNKSKEHDATFTWHVTNKRDAQYVTISPISGCLCPGEAVMLKATFTAFGVPAFYDLDLVCEVKNMTVQREFDRELKMWEDERCRQKVEFTCTEKNPNADLQMTECVDDDADRPASAKLKSLENGGNISPDCTELARYTTLPPIIKRPSCDDKSLNERLKKRFDEKFWPKPSQPKSFLLHLGLTVRSHDIAEFRQHFPNDYKKFFIDRTLNLQPEFPPLESACVEDGDYSRMCIPCCQTEADMLSLTVSNLLRSLLDDSLFHEACQQVVEEPIPYFQQFCSIKAIANEKRNVTHATQDLDGQESVPPTPTSALNSQDIERDLMTTEEEGLRTPISAREENAQLSGTRSQLSTGRTSQTNCLMNQLVLSPCNVGNTPPPPLAVDDAGDRSGRQDLEKAESERTDEDGNFLMKQKIKKLPGVCAEVEFLVENTLLNVLQEAFHDEFNITARPRLVALPLRPCLASSTTPRNGTKNAEPPK